VSATERLLRETLRDPERALAPGVGVLERARYDGERLRRRRRRRAVTLSVASTLAIVGVGAAFSPRLLPRPLIARPAAGPNALRVDDTAPAVPALPPGSAVPASPRPGRPTLWTEQIAGRVVTVVATYDGRRLCAQADRAADAVLRPARCSAVRAGSATALLAGPVGGPGGIPAPDASVTRIVILTSPRVANVIARPADGDPYVGYLQAISGPAGGRLFEVVLPAGQRVASLRLFDLDGTTVGTWTAPRR
jgi:hypothetical protein